MLKAGELRHRITIQSVTEAQDTYGEADGTWATFATVWAAMKALGGSEGFTAGTDRPQGRYLFTVRHRDDLTEKMRISYGGQTYDIESIQDPDGRKVSLEVLGVRRG